MSAHDSDMTDILQAKPPMPFCQKQLRNCGLWVTRARCTASGKIHRCDLGCVFYYQVIIEVHLSQNSSEVIDAKRLLCM